MVSALIISKTGIPCLAECGGSNGNSGRSQIIAGSSGEKKRAFFIIKGNTNESHAVVPICAGDLIFVAASNVVSGFVTVYQIGSIDMTAQKYSLDALEVVNFNAIQDHITKGSDYHRALTCAKDKARTVNCRRAMYAINPRFVRDADK